MIIRRELPDDVDAIRAVHLAAFASPRGRAAPVAAEDAGAPPPDPVEARLVDELRADAGAWLPELSLVAVGNDGEVIGHVVCTRGHVGGRPVLGLGPIGVLPDRQAGGVGAALMHAVLGAADALGEPLVALLGDPAYYRRFGFVTAGCTQGGAAIDRSAQRRPVYQKAATATGPSRGSRRRRGRSSPWTPGTSPTAARRTRGPAARDR